ncbi:MAG: ribosome recycling factor [Oligoflexia bacterium]|nr:ribosome recycling factor [Oligoflexia bacterium]
MQEMIKDMRGKMDKAIKNLEGELSKLRTGRASSAMLDGIKVDYYGTLTQLSQIASISVPEPRMLVVQPWEVQFLKEIETAIKKSDLGINPMNDGKVIRMKLPDLTEERRKDLTKVAKKIAEEAHVAVRMSRRDANDRLKELLKKKEITEDDNKRTMEQIQKITDEFAAKIDQISASKEKEILTV